MYNAAVRPYSNIWRRTKKNLEEACRDEKGKYWREQ